MVLARGTSQRRCKGSKVIRIASELIYPSVDTALKRRSNKGFILTRHRDDMQIASLTERRRVVSAHSAIG
jgi:hypothetical protein